jgi:hypothetical protein
MTTPSRGRVQGNTVVRDESVPPLDGKRVLVVLELAGEAQLSVQQNLDACTAWAATGPQGPIDDDDEPAFP